MDTQVSPVVDPPTPASRGGPGARPPAVSRVALAAALLLPPRLTPESVRYDRRYRTVDRYRFVCWFLAPPLLIYTVLVIWPFLQAFFYAMTDWTGFGGEFSMVWSGNFSRMWRDDAFWDALANSLVLLVLAPVITLALGLFFAYMLNAGGRHRRSESVGGVRGAAFYKIVYFLPQVLSVAIIAIVWARVFSPRSGLVNTGLEAVGLGSLAQDNWLGGSWARWVILLVLCWSFVGFYVVLFSAAMAAVPRDIYEAALLDGAGRAATFFRVTFPLTWDTVRTGWIYMGIQALDAFALVIVMVPRGGFDVLPTYLYLKAFREGQAGYATAVGVVLFLITLVFTLVMMRVGRRDRIEF
ncbi:carbohydrate ABC transporter permease [Streptomyces aidingensis]|uniref:N-acetylglucosamine transport system permease protein n=1 Tax=Streptomyces aidingensis TaxID=910347 RepID=A0A1I1ILM1_9ACTN|nr:sugar ABC transporter permease [Streptomyces aidingensis]SFC36592.1 N-acetylglucosamine transport system permease protein [Streptomyces aidingensis]